MKLMVYAISGVTAGLVSLERFSTISSTTAEGYELMVIAAAVVGGASLMGGRGTTPFSCSLSTPSLTSEAWTEARPC
jgi:ribose/xylose/arabinose/galactoside ABC-type transport system permease subunit